MRTRAEASLRPALITLAMAVLLGPQAPAIAAPSDDRGGPNGTFLVDTSSDTHDANPGDGRCADTDGRCSLRAAIEEANAGPADEAFDVTLPNTTLPLSLGTLDVTATSLTLTGAPNATTAIDAGKRFRLMHVRRGSAVSLTSLTILHGNAGHDRYGGGILNEGSLTVVGSRIHDNVASAGGGIANAGGDVEIDQSVISNNLSTAFGGGGIQNGGPRNVGGIVRIFGTTIRHNRGRGDGGGILNGQNGHPSARSVGAIAVRRIRIVHCRIEDNIDGNGGGGIANDGGTVVIVDTAIRHNHSSGSGGGIVSGGRFSLIGSAVVDNSAESGAGASVVGAGLPSAFFVVTDSLFKDNAGDVGGAIDDDASVVVKRSAFIANTATSSGAVIEVEGAEASFASSTIDGNVAPAGGGAIETYACGRVDLSYSTLSGNSVAIAASCPDVFIQGTIVAGSTSGTNCLGKVTEVGGFNLDDGTTCRFGTSNDLSGVDPLLGPLARHGGATPSHSLLAASPAIDAGERTDGCPRVDQRERPRPSGPACDIGAFEVQLQ